MIDEPSTEVGLSISHRMPRVGDRASRCVEPPKVTSTDPPVVSNEHKRAGLFAPGGGAGAGHAGWL